ncbi:maleylpyruvate isomerase family mycothiol-dependent enzyme [Streptomyces cavernicola]|uniref:Maleylpyruvate isomerase family mycothiol-dependent enzyme n=1 Tax=Streptomyces cavernicola TaxID=3043613 RepID=A0ABT6S9C6_9ACTN|nr:maleylpyruvate isomerase family mycothiol-dependent enzyme [Streptomyces sp. B-S-A6]MDI3404721.1 maleylpyruvate isomerase family mycothiol-dependent enzyme [Streptomyces sp. B-S-A6]
MKTVEHVQVLDREGRLLAHAAEEAGPGAAVATCPGWQVRDLLRHTGMVHRWATAYVVEGHTSPHPDGGLPDLDGTALLDWFRTGHATLVDALASAPADLDCWTFLPAPSPLAFWARRQAHETTVHRVDAESARSSSSHVAISPAFAVDGVDELLRGFHARQRSKVRTEKPAVLRVRGTDTGDVWTMRLSPDAPVTTRDEGGEADCELSGPAARVYLSLWNRLPAPRLTGDPGLARLWRETSGVTWG